MPNYLLVGGLIGLGFDSTGRFLLTVSHSGRGVFSTVTWTRLFRDTAVTYPKNGFIKGIGLLAEIDIFVLERDEKNEEITVVSPDGKFQLVGRSDGISIFAVDTKIVAAKDSQ